MHIISIGETLIDFIPGEAPGTYIRNPGGGPANAAVAMARAGCDVGLYSRLGDDDFGRFLKEVIASENVTLLTPDLTDEAVTTLAFVTLYEGGERSFTFARKPGADMLLKPEDIRVEDLEQTAFVSAASFSLSAEPVGSAVRTFLKKAHELGKLGAFDINYRDMVWQGDKDAAAAAVKEILPYIDFLKVSEEEVDMIGGEENFDRAMEEYGITAIIETLGSDGALCRFNGESIRISGRKVKAVDATGAGDAFWGGFLSQLALNGVRSVSDLTPELLKDALTYGNVAGSCCVGTKGGMTSLPTRAEVEAILRA